MRESAGGRLEAVWESDAERGRSIADALEVPFVADLEELLAMHEAAGVIVTDAPSRKQQILLKRLGAGKHVLSEKLVAPSVNDLDALTPVADSRGATLACAMPFLGRASVARLIAAAGDGSIENITAVRTHLAIDGVTRDWRSSRFDDPAEAVVGTWATWAARRPTS